jgi:hypothetical protein
MKRIVFYFEDCFGKTFQSISFPYEKGDAAKGYLRKAIKLVIGTRQLFTGILVREHGMTAPLKIRIEFLIENKVTNFEKFRASLR